MKRFYREISEEEGDVCSVSAGACTAVWAMTCYDKKHYRVTSAVQNPSHPAVCEGKHDVIVIFRFWVSDWNWSRLDYRKQKRLKGSKIFNITRTCAHTCTHILVPHPLCLCEDIDKCINLLLTLTLTSTLRQYLNPQTVLWSYKDQLKCPRVPNMSSLCQ